MSERLVITIPVEDVDQLLEALEQTVEDIEKSECDCDDCVRMICTLDELVKQIHAAAPLKKEG